MIINQLSLDNFELFDLITMIILYLVTDAIVVCSVCACVQSRSDSEFSFGNISLSFSVEIERGYNRLYSIEVFKF